MMCSTLVLVFLSASAAFALPSSHEQFIASVPSDIPVTAFTQYSANWAGAVLNAPAGTFRDVRATFTVPTIHKPVDQPDGEYSASIWVGLDGDTCWGASVRSGVDIVVNASGVHAQGWFAAHPGIRTFLRSNPVHAGDRVTLRVEMRDAAAGTAHAFLDNLTTRWTSNGPRAAGAPLCAQDAVWVVENPARDGALAPFADFTTVLFDTANVTLATGERVGPEGARPIEMYQGRVLTDVAVKPSSVRVTYL
ncbi:peptidase G1 domain-containing protein [Phanerochaete sordida]|uniref:Peptidase G1 domain-containing protein n=1 Tax=Phanerochaete sordida TaxID=48140 RepID=A0A9P3LIX4_9APHY|nr:peptidase G1 domain-containing protein [Phanerochaete sordida]